MSKEIDNKIIRFMEEELTRGHFEHTIREISKGTELSYNAVTKGVERLKTKGLISFRSRGGRNRPTPFYYLNELGEKFANIGKNTRARGKMDIEAKTKKQNWDIQVKGGAS